LYGDGNEAIVIRVDNPGHISLAASGTIATTMDPNENRKVSRIRRSVDCGNFSKEISLWHQERRLTIQVQAIFRTEYSSTSSTLPTLRTYRTKCVCRNDLRTVVRWWLRSLPTQIAHRGCCEADTNAYKY